MAFFSPNQSLWTDLSNKTPPLHTTPPCLLVHCTAAQQKAACARKKEQARCEEQASIDNVFDQCGHSTKKAPNASTHCKEACEDHTKNSPTCAHVATRCARIATPSKAPSMPKNPTSKPQCLHITTRRERTAHTHAFEDKKGK